MGIGETVLQQVTWSINATNMTPYTNTQTITVSANTTDDLLPADFYQDDNTTTLTVYQLFPVYNYTSLPITIQADQESIIPFPCTTGMYRNANITVNWSSTDTEARILTNNNTMWTDILHSETVNTETVQEILILQIY